MSWLYQRNHVYYVGWRDAQGKTHGRSFRTRNRRVAEAALRKFRRELGAELPATRPAPPETVARAVELYLSSAASRMRPATYRAVHSRLQHGLARFADRDLGSLEPRDFDAYRDRRMAAWHRLFPQYNFAQNKGYATPEHLEALRAWGPCPLHRRTFKGVKEWLPEKK